MTDTYLMCSPSGLFAKPEALEDAVAGTSAGAATASRSVRSARSGGNADAPKSSAYKGVSWHKHSQKWYAYIQAAGKMRGLGYFDHQEDAARAYDTEARKVGRPELALLECTCYRAMR